MMDEDEEEALFARLKRALDSVRRDASLAQSDPTSPPPAPDPELIAAVARVEASLRALASNLESLARRTDGLEAGIEARIETTVARATAGLRAELARLSARIPIQTAPPETPRPDIVLPSAERPLGSAERPSLAVPARRRRRGRPLLIGVVVLALVALGAAAATRLGYGLDAYPIGREMQARWAGWRAAWFPDPASLSGPDATAPAPPDAPPPAPPVSPAPQPAPEPPPSKAAVALPLPPPPVVPAPSSPPPSTEQAAVPVTTPTPTPTPPLAPAALPSVPAPVTSPATSESAGDSTPAAARLPPPPPAPTVMLRAKAPVWVEVREKTGHVLLRRTLQTGETWPVPADPNLLLSAGNVRGLEIVVNGAPQALPASKSGVLRDAPLDGT